MSAPMARTTRERYLNYSKGERVLCVGVGSFALFARTAWRDDNSSTLGLEKRLEERLRNG
jgi:hypothetical protein